MVSRFLPEFSARFNRFIIVVVVCNLIGIAVLPARLFFFGSLGAFFGGFLATGLTYYQAIVTIRRGTITGERARRMLIAVAIQWAAVACALTGILRFLAGPMPDSEVTSLWGLSKIVSSVLGMTAMFLQITAAGRINTTLYFAIVSGMVVGLVVGSRFL